MPSRWTYQKTLKFHGANLAEQDQFCRDRLLPWIDAMFNQEPNLLSHDRDSVISISRDDLLSGSTNAIETWLNMVKHTIQCCLQDSQDKLLHHQSDIQDFFDEASDEDSNAVYKTARKSFFITKKVTFKISLMKLQMRIPMLSTRQPGKASSSPRK